MRPDRRRVRSSATWSIDRTLDTKRPVDGFLHDVESDLEFRDRNLLYQLTLGTLRWLRRLDHVIESASARKIEQIDRELRTPLRVAIYEILFLDRIPTYASVSEAVDEARRRTHQRGGAFVNAVLRKVARRPDLEHWPIRQTDLIKRLGIETSHPDFLVSRWIDQFGESATRRILDSNNIPKPLHLLTFKDRGNASVAARELHELGISTELSQVAPYGLIVRDGDPLSSAAFNRGDLYVQDEASQAAALIPLPGPNDRILDLAAAPGGKTFSLLASEPNSDIFASDLTLDRIALLNENSIRLGRGVRSVVADAALPAFRTGFDRVVLDLPCSGTGTLRKHPELKWRISSAELQRLCRQGLALALGAAELPRPGGLLVVSTCSLEEEESVGVVRSMMESSGEYDLVELAEQNLGAPAGYIAGSGFWRVLPSDDHDGLTVHVLRRRAT